MLKLSALCFVCLFALPFLAPLARAEGEVKLSPYCQKRLNRFGLRSGSEMFGVDAYKKCDSFEKRSEEIFASDSTRILNNGRSADNRAAELTSEIQAGAIQECKDVVAGIKLAGAITKFVCIPLEAVRGPLESHYDYLELRVHTVVFLVDSSKLSTSEYYLNSY